MKSFKQLSEGSFPKYYKTSKSASIKKIADRYFETGDKLYDVDWVRGEYHIMASTKEVDKYKEHNWSRKKSRRGSESYEELYQDIKENGIKLPLQIFLYQFEHRINLGEGNHRLAIAKELGIKNVPVVFTFWKGKRPKDDDDDDDDIFDDIIDKNNKDIEDKELKKLFRSLGINL